MPLSAYYNLTFSPRCSASTSSGSSCVLPPLLSENSSSSLIADPDDLGPHRRAHDQVRVQARLGDLAVPGVLRTHGVPMVRIQPNDDQRGIASASDVPVLRPVLSGE